MIGWQNPAALWGLALVAAPVIVHLLRRHRAQRVLFPSVRFVQTTQTAAVRFRLPADWVLLVVRSAIVALAVVAVAGPIALTASRMSRWNSTVARAVVVDSTESVRSLPGNLIADSIASEMQGAAYERRFDANDVMDGITRAAAWLQSTPPSRKELVILSDFQRGAVEQGGVEEALARVSPIVGIRLVAVGKAMGAATFEGAPLLGTASIGARDLTVDVTPSSTAAVLRDTQLPSAGIRVLTAQDGGESVARMLDVAAQAGAPAADPSQPIVVRFSGAVESVEPLEPVRGWMLALVNRLGPDRSLRALAASAARASAVREELPWVVALRDRDGKPLIAAARSRDRLVLDAGVAPDTFLAAAIVRAALTARLGIDHYKEREIARVDERRLATLTRTPGAVTADAWRNADVTDARRCWLGVLVLMGLEQWLRAWSRTRDSHEDARAAA